ncbi:MAG: ribosome biogenesis GTP-binding protein YihA/YsxC [Ruminococcus flavefaciens]|nr:ribosome biogenesis GTP-binding protein YihA/YsxC [Ruminococcus flavefaciens]
MRKLFKGVLGWVGLITLIIGIGLLAFAVWYLTDTLITDAKYVRVEAEVVDIAEVRVHDGKHGGYKWLYAEVVEFEVNGVTYRAQNNSVSDVPKSIGSKMTVAYDPIGPGNYFFPSSNYSFAPLSFVLAAGFTACGIVCLRLDHKEKKMEKLLLSVPNAEFMLSAGSKEQFIKAEKPIIAISGKSNVGKSSFINMVTNRKKLAKVSKDPGRTRLINYFDCGKFILADLPGYGYAKVSKDERFKWAALLDDFFSGSANLCHVFALVDIRHEPTADDKQMIDYLYFNRIPFTVIATKADKLSRAGINKNKTVIAREIKCGTGNIIATSAQTKQGLEEVLNAINAVIKRTEEEDA